MDSALLKRIADLILDARDDPNVMKTRGVASLQREVAQFLKDTAPAEEKTMEALMADV